VGKKSKLNTFTKSTHRDNGQKFDNCILPLAPSSLHNLWTKWQKRACHHVIHTTTNINVLSFFKLRTGMPSSYSPSPRHLLNTAYDLHLSVWRKLEFCPTSQVGLAQMLLKLWASLKWLYQRNPFLKNAISTFYHSFNYFHRNNNQS
jgi:hypothetical protein